jgi:hypothetical protein
MHSIHAESKVIDADRIVHTHVIGESYHVAWANKTGMVWKLKALANGIAFLETPKTKRPMQTKISDLREVNRNVYANCEKRLKKAASNS